MKERVKFEWNNRSWPVLFVNYEQMWIYVGPNMNRSNSINYLNFHMSILFPPFNLLPHPIWKYKIQETRWFWRVFFFFLTCFTSFISYNVKFVGRMGKWYGEKYFFYQNPPRKFMVVNWKYLVVKYWKTFLFKNIYWISELFFPEKRNIFLNLIVLLIIYFKSYFVFG